MGGGGRGRNEIDRVEREEAPDGSVSVGGGRKRKIGGGRKD